MALEARTQRSAGPQGGRPTPTPRKAAGRRSPGPRILLTRTREQPRAWRSKVIPGGMDGRGEVKKRAAVRAQCPALMPPGDVRLGGRRSAASGSASGPSSFWASGFCSETARKSTWDLSVGIWAWGQIPESMRVRWPSSEVPPSLRGLLRWACETPAKAPGGEEGCTS